MAGYNSPTITPGKIHEQTQTHLRCLQLNLHHSRLATDNLNKIIEEENIDILCIQEPYEIRKQITGFPRRLKIFIEGEGKHRAAILVNNNRLDTILLKQLSDEDAVVTELILGNKKNTTSSVNDCTVEDVELLTSPTEC